MGKEINNIYAMYRHFGTTKHPDAICRDCRHLKTHQAGGRKVYKCTVYGETSSDATDWRIGWIACGMYGKPYDGTPVMDLKHQRKKADPEEQIPGQMSLF